VGRSGFPLDPDGENKWIDSRTGDRFVEDPATDTLTLVSEDEQA
jgi:hypothetical protein